MGTTNTTTDFQIRLVADDEAAEMALSDFLAANEDGLFDGEADELRALAPGETFHGGGGAWGAWTVTRIDCPDCDGAGVVEVGQHRGSTLGGGGGTPIEGPCETCVARPPTWARPPGLRIGGALLRALSFWTVLTVERYAVAPRDICAGVHLAGGLYAGVGSALTFADETHVDAEVRATVERAMGEWRALAVVLVEVTFRPGDETRPGRWQVVCREVHDLGALRALEALAGFMERETRAAEAA